MLSSENKKAAAPIDLQKLGLPAQDSLKNQARQNSVMEAKVSTLYRGTIGNRKILRKKNQ